MAAKVNFGPKPKVGDERICPKCHAKIVVRLSMIRNGQYVCSKCSVKDVVEYARNHKDWKIRQRKKFNRSKKGKIYLRDRYKKYVAKYPERRRAREKAAYAIKCGILKKNPCEKCGKRKVHAHHDDYEKPLKVRWLCPMCHYKHHAALIAEYGRRTLGA